MKTLALLSTAYLAVSSAVAVPHERDRDPRTGCSINICRAEMCAPDYRVTSDVHIRAEPCAPVRKRPHFPMPDGPGSNLPKSPSTDVLY